MAGPNWYWPPSGMTARSISLVSFGGRLAIPDWLTPRFFPFDPTIPAITAPVVLATGTPGIAAAAADASGGLWMISFGGNTYRRPPAGGIVTGALASGKVYNGAAFLVGSGIASATDGSVYFASGVGGGGGTLLGSWPVSAIGMTWSGAMLAALLPVSGLVGTMTTAGVTGSIALPPEITAPSCMALLSGGVVAAGGWANAPPLAGGADAAIDPQNDRIMLAAGSGSARIWSNLSPLSENWSEVQTVTGLINLNSVAWRPDGTQILATSPIVGAVQALNYIASVLSLDQTLVVSGAVSVAIAGTSINALVAQSGQSQAATLSFGGGSWSTGTPVTGLPGIQSLASVDATHIAATVSGGVSIIALAAGSWTISSTTALGFTPTVIAVDKFTRIFAAGSGAVAMISGTTMIASGTWAGAAPTSIDVHNGRIVMPVPSDNLIRIFARSDQEVLSQQGSLALALGTSVGIGTSDTVAFVLGSGATNMYGFSGSPFVLTPVTQGIFGQWNGSAWTTSVLGIGHNPSSVAFDTSGTAWLSTVQGTYFNMSSGATVLASGTIPVFPQQLQTVPLGISVIIPVSGQVYVSSSLAGVLTEVL